MPEHAEEVQPMTSTNQTGTTIQSTNQSKAEEEDDDWITVDEQFVHVEINGLYRDDVLKSCTTTEVEGAGPGEERSQFQLTGMD